MTAQLRAMLCDHAAGNYRILTTMAAQLLAAPVRPAAGHRRSAVLSTDSATNAASFNTGGVLVHGRGGHRRAARRRR
jgi:hypothetical protein